ncbi:hypothetical protein [Shinella granuli]|uniref:Uncharacterized protein n=1 Tax=Shinella granuli TaxID=323621 RepID=A0A4R2BX48_SHIGR|nr:hypothetical protein [Shinella granuli]TCN31635.1 hypothetical protein EV665_15211 [Shinella granuli]
MANEANFARQGTLGKSQMTSSTARATAADRWNRCDYILAGQRLYSNRATAQWLAGKQPLARFELPLPLTPEAERAPWIPERFLDLLVDGDDVAESGRYVSTSERLRRLFGIVAHFVAIRHGFILPTHRVRPVGTLVWMENDGPTATWLARAMAIWATLPPNDSDIFDRAASTEKPKNAHLADSLNMLLTWARMRKPLSLSGTNWMRHDNDNYVEGEDRPASNLQRRIRPGSSDAELKSYIKKAGPTVEWRHARIGGGGDIECRPTDITLQTVPDKTDRAGKVKKSHATIVRAGKLRIANGKTKIRVESIEAGKTNISMEHVEEGTILHQPDKFGELMGPEPDPAEKVRAASYWSSLYKVDRSSVVETGEDGSEKLRFLPRGKMRRKVRFTAEDHAVLLAGPRPPVTRYPDGLPLGSEDISASFVGGWISSPKGKQPAERWEDISDEMARQGEFERWAAALPANERKALNIASTAANLEEVGEAFGKKEKTAERFGKKILKAANENLKKLAAA